MRGRTGDLSATSWPTPKSVLRHDRRVRQQRARLEREAEIMDAWREDNAERGMNGIPHITLADFKRRMVI